MDVIGMKMSASTALTDTIWMALIAENHGIFL